MSPEVVYPWERALARLCEICPVCRHARQSQKGIAYNFVKNVEVGVCPFCRAYERVHGRKAHEKKRAAGIIQS